MPICPLHGAFNVATSEGECPKCKEEGIVATSVEYDKQDRVRDTMLYEGLEFLPLRSRAIMVFKKEDTECAETPIIPSDECLLQCLEEDSCDIPESKAPCATHRYCSDLGKEGKMRDKCYNVDCSDHDETEPDGCYYYANVDRCRRFVSKEKWKAKIKELGLSLKGVKMNNVEAAYTLITAEAERRHKNELFNKKTSDLCGKLVEVSQEVDSKLFAFMIDTRQKEREEKKKCEDQSWKTITTGALCAKETDGSQETIDVEDGQEKI